MFKPEETSKDPKPEEHKDDDEGDDDDEDVEKEVVGNWKIVDLPEMAAVTGEQQEEELAKFRSKIYRFRGEWKERGVGELRFLKHKTSGMIRVLNRAEKTHKCIMNHFTIRQEDVLGKLEQLKTSNNTWTWAAQDISDEVPQVEKFCARFTSKEDFEKFQTVFNESCETNGKLIEALKAKQETKEEEKKEEKVEDKK